MNKGGKREGSGRKRLEQPSVLVQFRISPEQRENLKLLGGRKWLLSKLTNHATPASTEK